MRVIRQCHASCTEVSRLDQLIGFAAASAQQADPCPQRGGKAVLEGRDFGLLVEPTDYQFVVYQTRRQRWELLNQEREFRRRELPKGLSFELTLDSRIVVLKTKDERIKSDAPVSVPQLIIAASGEGTPFRLTLERAGTEAKAAVTADSMGKLKVESSDQTVKKI